MRQSIFKPLALKMLELLQAESDDLGDIAFKLYRIVLRTRKRKKDEMDGIISSVEFGRDGAVTLGFFHAGSDVVEVVGTPNGAMKNIPTCAWLEVSVPSLEKLNRNDLVASWSDVIAFIEMRKNSRRPLSKSQSRKAMEKRWGSICLTRAHSRNCERARQRV